MSWLIRGLIVSLALLGALALAGVLAFARSGVAARPEPTAWEVWSARAARHLLIPASARSRTNPLVATPERLEDAREHWVDHCTPCHGSDGRGNTALGGGLHPRVPDLTLAATQDLPEGELFWIIENGVKLTGMPAWGEASPDDDAHAWALVLWIRHLPEVTAGEIEQMDRGAGAARSEHLHREHSHEAR